MSLKFRIYHPTTNEWIAWNPNSTVRRKLARKNSSLKGELGRVLAILA